MPIINFKALSIGDGYNSWNTDSSYDLSRIIFRTLGNGIGSSGRVPVSVQDINKRVTSFLARYTSPKDLQQRQGFNTRNEDKIYSCDVGVLDPRLKYERANRVYDNNGIVILGSYSLNECITTVPRCQIFSVVKFSITQRLSYE